MNPYPIALKNVHNNNATLVAVSKMQSNEKLMTLYQLGQRIFAENRPQELERKYHDLPKDIEWHLIGHLQSNKIKLILPYVKLIHSVDSFELAKKINNYANELNIKTRILLQIKLSPEETKFGFEYEDLIHSLKNDKWDLLSNINICGVMGLGSLTSDHDITRTEFKRLNKYFIFLKKFYFSGDAFKEISMGMSNDYLIALEEGATMVRLGSLIFQ